MKQKGLILIIGIFCLSYIFETKNYQISYDSLGYYAYLPALVHLKDIQLHNTQILDSINKLADPNLALYQIYKVKDSEHSVIRYPAGLALAYAPGYFVGYIISNLVGADHEYGFNLIFKKSVFYWSFLVTLIGIYFLFQFIRFYYNDFISTITVGLIVIGTNYFFHSMMHGHGLMSHNYLFTLYSMLLYYTHQYYLKHSYKYLMFIFLVCALIATIRNSELFCFLIPLLYGINSWSGIWINIKGLFEKPLKLMLAILPGLVIVMIQLLYWKIVTGQWFYYSYQDNAGQTLELSKPYILEVLFSARKGLFIYTPLTLIFIIGLFQLKKCHTEWFNPIFIFTMVNLYLIASWTCWWYAESFGQRAIIPMYPVFALGFASLISKMMTKKLIPKLLFFSCIFLIVVLNLFQTWQIRQGILAANFISKDYYLSVFGQSKPVDESQKELLLEKPIDGFIQNENGPNLNVLDKEFSYATGITDSLVLHSEQSKTLERVILHSDNPYSKGITIPNKYLNNSRFKYLHITECIGLFDHKIPKFGIVSNMERHGKQYNWFMSPQLTNEQVHSDTLALSYWMMIPQIERDKDILKIFVWNPSKDSLQFFGLHVDVYAPKIKKNIFFW
ncbi:MAG: hypothetical protein IPQ02_16795 [Saprospiraceae bacterium]|uniref:Glycosyltransferase RgtA/B/C/D-like domain-containing protein n=1 Tax=Candidatus Defluviibacterium haderslevense TaxID=2981993 RepID=A0A9D7XIF3_9BACT|nr:hypothetical protein [Candidatus Defluviibacterium haderslevense]MBL0238197.1 hypothetical protein [Candidatus Defluviibacterium haderslevense]